jgi:hypothetical protein
MKNKARNFLCAPIVIRVHQAMEIRIIDMAYKYFVKKG